MTQQNLSLAKDSTTVEELRFEPIRGYPMLHWKGKRPFNGTQFYPAQLKETYGEAQNNWINKIFLGDNLQVMSHLLKAYRGKVDLVYIDPPFDSKADYKKKISLKGKQATNDQNAFEEKQYTDIWTNDEYLQFMYERLIMIRELLSEKGSLWLHCDWHKSHYLRIICDEVFGNDSFKNEIVWHYYNKMQGNIGRFASNHDTLLLYSKTSSIVFNKIQEKREKPVQQIKRVWDKETQSLKNAKDDSGRVIYIEATHKTVDDVWRMSMLQPADQQEPVGYPTQKPEALLERIISASSNPGDLVFDCFMGSGTTQAVAMKLGRRFIGADINLGAIDTTVKRLAKICAEIRNQPPQIEIELGDSEEGGNKKKVETFYTGFEVYNVNHYDVFRNPVEAKQILLQALEVQPIPGNATAFDGEKDGRMVKIMPVNRIATHADLNELLANLNEKTYAKKFSDNPTKPVESITLVCMGHDPDLAAQLKNELKPWLVDVEVVDILRDKSNLEFKRDSELKVISKGGRLRIEEFYPMNLLQKLSYQKESVEDYRELVDSVKIDWNYDGAIFNPTLIDFPSKNELVSGDYEIPKDAGTIRIKVTDLLSESVELSVAEEK